jgi:ABC-type sugar transport system permease subunit
MKRRDFYLFSAPSIVALVMFLILPLAMALWQSFYQVTYNNLRTPVYIGLDNYKEILTDPRFWHAVQFTVLLIIIGTSAEILIGFGVAMLLDQISKKVRGLFLAIFLTTYISVPVVAALMFRELFRPTGLGAWLFKLVTGHPFLFTAFSVKVLIILYSIWRDTPFVIIIVFAGLQTLLQELLEAAAIDGASRWQQIRYITIPHLKPLIILIAMIVIMARYNTFDSVYVLTNMNPVFNADTIMTYNYRVALQLAELGRGNAMSILSIIGIMVVLIPFLRHTYRSQVGED